MSITRIQQALTSLRRLDHQIARCFEYKPYEWYSFCHNDSLRHSRLPQLKEAFDGGVIASACFVVPIGITGACLGYNLYPMTIFVACVMATTCDGLREVIAEEIKKEERLKPPKKAALTHVLQYTFDAGKALLKTPKAFIEYPLTMLTSWPEEPHGKLDNWVTRGCANSGRVGFTIGILGVALSELIRPLSAKEYGGGLVLSVGAAEVLGLAHGLTNYLMNAVEVVDQKRKQHDQTFPSKCAARLFALPGQVARYTRDTVVQFPERFTKAVAKEDSGFYFKYYALMGFCLGAIATMLSFIVRRPVDSWSDNQRIFVGGLLGIPLSQYVAVRDMADGRGLYQHSVEHDRFMKQERYNAEVNNARQVEQQSVSLPRRRRSH